FERRGREGVAEIAEKKSKIWLFLFCVFRESFASSAFKAFLSDRIIHFVFNSDLRIFHAGK
ncbi:MAG: hypothetical protein ACKO1L_05770, partial [Brachymonas sp.]